MSSLDQEQETQNFQMIETFTSSPITSIKFIPKFENLLIASGDTLLCYKFNKVQFSLISKVKIFKNNKIHGIDFNSTNDTVLCFGGRSLSVFNINLLFLSDNGDITIHQSALNDWIISACFDIANSDDEIDSNIFYLLNAHNIVTSVSYDPSSSLFPKIARIPLKVENVVDCNEKSILYSGNLKVLNSKILVFAGTVMSGIYVWQFPRNSSTKTTGKIINHLQDHEGSIFNVKCNKDATLAVSCSDDRSIKVWDLKTNAVLTTSYGHGSRIWDLEIFKESNSTEFYLLSTSEDLTCRLWKYDESSRMCCIKVLDSHQGKNVWCGDILNDRFIVSGGNDGRVRFYDLENHITPKQNNNRFEITLESLISSIKANGEEQALFKNENIRDVITGKNGKSMLVITSFGKIFRVENINIDNGLNKQNVEWIKQPEIPNDSEEIERINLEKCQLENEKRQLNKQIQIFLEAGGDSNKDIKQLKKLKLKRSQLEANEKFPKQAKYNFVSNYFVINQGCYPNSEQYFDLFITNSSGYQIVYKFNSHNLEVLQSGNIKNVFNNKLSKFEFSKISNIFNISNNNFIFESPNPDNPLIFAHFNSNKFKFEKFKLLNKPKTRFVISCITYSEKFHYLIICSRFATFSIYDLSLNNEDSDMQIIDPIQTWKKIIQGDTITEVKILEEFEKFFILSILLRDGDYLYLKLFFNSNPNNSKYNDIIQGLSELSLSNLQIEILQKNRISKGGSLEGSIFSKSGNAKHDLLFYGFKSNYFYLYNETKDFEVWSELCGGSHRLWKFSVLNGNENEKANNNHFQFLYVRDNCIILEKFKLEHLILEGSHGKEIRDLSVNNNQDNILITGGEDNTIKISKIIKDSENKICNLENLWTIRKHISGLQKLKFISDDMFISCAAREELFIWKLNKISENNNGKGDFQLYVNCYSELTPSVSDNHDLRIMDFDYLPIFDSNNVIVSYLLSLVYSNSYIKIFNYILNEKRFIPLLTEKYKQNCLLNTKFLLLRNNLYLLITGTDGYITIYKLSNSWNNQIPSKFLNFRFELIINEKIHQNGIKSLEFFKFEDAYIVAFDIISGGDDNEISVFRFGINNAADVENNLEFGKLEYCIDNAASSAITSISKLHNDKIFIVSVDQVLRVWQVRRNEYNKVALQLIGKQYTTIADTGCGLIHVDNEDSYAIFGGVGLSIIKVKF